MTAKSILFPQGRVFTAEEIEAIVAVAEDPVCPDVMDVPLVEAAARFPESRRQNGGEMLFDTNTKARREHRLMAAVREIARHGAVRGA